MSNSPKNKIRLPKPAVPRSKEDIQVDYNKSMTDLATASYLEFVYAKNKEQINNTLVSLNQELKARYDLDAKEVVNEPDTTQQPEA